MLFSNLKNKPNITIRHNIGLLGLIKGLKIDCLFLWGYQLLKPRLFK
jgi:hypothetical protein